MPFPPLPPDLRALAERRAEGLRFPATMSEGLSESWPRVLAWSEFVAGVLRAQPDLLEGEWLAGLERPLAMDDIRRRVDAALADAADEPELMRRLRRIRQAWSARIAWRDIAGWADVAETVSVTSAVADALVDGALARLHAWHRERHGEARDAAGRPLGLVVLGMGKLGGGELNFSSDIDLIFAYPENGESDGQRPLANEQYFARLGQRLIRVLDERTADGFVFRVDMRLRPFGDGGPLVMSFNGTESYYEQHGREWERYAFIKARPVAGDLAVGEALLARLRPFVYRRYLDFNVFESLREMKAAINREVARRELDNHVKLGPGGIREAEFVLQLFQLIRGGREPALRARGFRAALATAIRTGCLPTRDGEALAEAYDFLRRLENRLQQRNDAQAHEVPEDAAERMALACSLGFASVEAFEAEWRRHRETVRRLFDDVFLGHEPKRGDDGLGEAWRAPEAHVEAFTEAGFRQPEAVAEALARLHAHVEKYPPGAQGGRRLEKLMPLLLQAAARQPEPELALARMLRLIEAVLGRTTYLSLLLENPRALEQLARICAASDWIAQFVTRHPVLLDELIDPRLFEEAPTRESLEEELAEQLARAPSNDLEAMLDGLREYQQVSMMRIAAADISGVLPLMKVSDRLTDVAELVIQAALDMAEAHLVERHGEPRCGQERRARFLVVGYGKFGGLELGYGSDLDLVFLHDSSGEIQQTDGPRPLDNNLFFLRLTQRLIHFLSTPTAAGTLYEVDTRLRPSGQAGLLVSSMEAFEKYQREQAWTWEHQALLRARPVAGAAELAEAFRRLRVVLLSQPRDDAKLRREVLEMRARMRAAAGEQPGQFDLKNGFGGITDVEFLAQYWVLREAHHAPELLEFTDTIRFLEGLESCGRVPAARLEGLVDAYLELRHSVHALALQGRPPVLPESLHEATRGRVQAAWRAEFGEDGVSQPLI